MLYVHIPLKDRRGKVGHRRAYQGHFVGYLFTSTVFDNFIILEVLENGHYGKIRHSKDVIFDTSINFLRPDPNTFPSDEDFFPPELEPLPLDPYPEPVPDEFAVPDIPVPAVPDTPDPVPAAPEPALNTPSAPLLDITHDSYAQLNENHHIDSNIDKDSVPVHPDAVYWYSTFFDDTSHEYFYSMVETIRVTRSIAIKDPDVPKTFWAAMRQP